MDIQSTKVHTAPKRNGSRVLSSYINAYSS